MRDRRVRRRPSGDFTSSTHSSGSLTRCHGGARSIRRFRRSILPMSSASRVLKGSAPVMYGATSFVGVVQVLHYPAGQSTQQIDLAGGSYGSARGDLSMVLPGTDTFRNS